MQNEKLADVRTTPRFADEVSGRNAASLEVKRDHACKWHECPLEEKVERLRRELLSQRGVVEYAAATATQAHDLSKGHSHDLAGRVTVLADDRMNRLTGAVSGGRGFDPLA